MLSADPYYKKKRRFSWGYFILFLFVSVLALVIYTQAERWIYRFSDDPILSIQKRSEKYEADLLAGKTSSDELKEFIVETRKILDILEKDQAAVAEVHYFHGLFSFYELVLHISPGAPNLVKLAGRGMIPEQRKFEEIEKISIIKLSREIGLRIRLARAIDPELKWSERSRLALVFGDFFFNTRLDRNLLKVFNRIEGEQIAPALKVYYEWMALLLFSFFEEKEKLERLVDDLRERQENPEENPGGLRISGPELDLILCFGAYNSRDFINALRSARNIDDREVASDWIRMEATRMEGEIFQKQRGDRAALPYFQKALEISGGKDQYLKRKVELLAGGN